MKVYEIKELGETTYFCFDGGIKRAKEWYVEECGSEIDSLILFPRKNWKTITIKYEADDIPEDEQPIMTIEEYMKDQISNEVICSTAFL